MTQKRRQFTAEFKSRVARAALPEDKTLAQLASEFGVHPNQITEWTRQALESLPDVFSRKRKKQQQDNQQLIDRLYRQIGELQVDVNWMKKNQDSLGLTYPVEARFGLSRYFDYYNHRRRHRSLGR